MVSLDSAQETRDFTDRYQQILRETTGETAERPKMGIGRFVVIAETNDKALQAARRAYAVWHRNFYHLYKRFGGAPAHPRPPDFDGVIKTGQGIAGSPQSAATFLKSQLLESDSNYLV